MKAHLHKLPLTETQRCRSCLLVLMLFLGLHISWSTAWAQDAANPVADIVKIPAKGLGLAGGEVEIATHVFKPTTAPPYPVLLFSHGRSGERMDRVNLKNPLALGHVRYWLNKGYAIVAPVRVGYGETGGPDRENSGARYDSNGVCTSRPDPSNTVKFAVSSVLPVLEWVREQTWAKKDRILLEGQSVGGLTTVALCSQNLPGVIGCINFAGGAGGAPQSMGKMCSPEILSSLMAQYGATTKLPNIWLYAENDLYWGAESPKMWHKDFAQGGSPTEFIATPPVPNVDGHLLLMRGGAMWSTPLNAWLKKHSF